MEDHTVYREKKIIPRVILLSLAAVFSVIALFTELSEIAGNKVTPFDIVYTIFLFVNICWNICFIVLLFKIKTPKRILVISLIGLILSIITGTIVGIVFQVIVVLLSIPKRSRSISSKGGEDGMDGIMFKILGVNGQCYVYENRVVIERKGVLGFLTQGLAGSKTIPINSIESVQYKEGNSAVNGFIQFGVRGGLEGRKGVFRATHDENTVMFSAANNHVGRLVKDYIEARILNRDASGGTTVINQLSGADELKKYKELLDTGVINQEEFDAKKKQILGI